MAAGTVIYGRSGDAVFRIRNTHGDSTPRPAAGAVICGIFGDVAPEIGNAHEDSTSRIPKRLALSRNRSLARRFCRVLSVRWGTRSSVSRAARRFRRAGPQNRGIFESQLPQFACGTPVLASRSVKTRHNGGPEAPGGGLREATGARIWKKYVRNRHLSLVLEEEIVAVAPPARGRRPAALRPTVEPACRTQSGRSGFQICRASVVRRQRIGVPHAIRATRIPGRPRFCDPAARIRRAARNLGNPGFRYAALMRSGGLKSACRFPAPALPDPRDSAAPTRSVGIRATVGASIYIYIYIYIS